MWRTKVVAEGDTNEFDFTLTDKSAKSWLEGQRETPGWVILVDLPTLWVATNTAYPRGAHLFIAWKEKR